MGTAVTFSNNRLEFCPISLFALVMGLSGLSLAWSQGGRLGIFPALPALVSIAFTLVAMVGILAVYGVKLLRHPARVREELHHPIRMSFFPTVSISFVLAGTMLLHIAPDTSFWLWAVGAVGQLGFVLLILSFWIHHDTFEVQHFNPAWFIPVVGNVLVPVAGVAHAPAELNWFYFSVGVLFWLVLMTILFYRVFFHPPLPERLMPTLFILIAPPAVSFLAYVKLTGGLDPFARFAFYSALFLTLLLFTQARRFARLPFALSWWAYSFPLAAMTVATLTMHELSGLAFFRHLGAGLHVVLNAVIALLLVKTFAAARAGKICAPEE
jgi:tellurite resistance protein